MKRTNYILRILAAFALSAIVPLFSVSSVQAAALGDSLWVTASDSSVAQKVDMTTNAITGTVATGNFPLGVSVDETYVWVNNLHSDTITRITKSDSSVMTFSGFTLDNAYNAVYADPQYVWFNTEDHKVMRIDKNTNTVSEFATILPEYGQELYADADSVWVINVALDSVTRIKKNNAADMVTIPVGDFPIRITSDAQFAWVTNYLDSSISKIDKSTNSVTDVITLSSTPNAGVITVDDQYLWVSFGDDFAKLDKATGTVVGSISLGYGLNITGISQDTNHIWLTERNVNRLVKIAKSDLSVIAVINTAASPAMVGDATGFDYDRFYGGPVVQEVGIDIKPGNAQNCFNNNEAGVLPVAILGAVDTDVSMMDPASISLNGLSVKVAGKSNKYLAHTGNVNDDAFTDLILQIEDTDRVYQPGDTAATLTGRYYSGEEFIGHDMICIVP